MRPGEKLHEEMISPDDGPPRLRLGDRYVVQPDLASWGYQPPVPTAIPVHEGFAYRSDTNDLWLTPEEMRQDRSRTTYERDAAVRAAVDRRGRRRGRHRGAARRLADHRPGGRPPSRRDLADCTGGASVVTVTSGTAALHVAVRRRGRRPRRRGRHDAADVRGDRVVAPPCSARTVVFADVEEDTGNLDPEAAEAALTARTRVVAGGRLRRPPGRDRRAARRGRRRGAPCCWRTRRTRSARATAAARSGTLADLTTFSFFPTKNLTTAEGGAVATSDPSPGHAGRPVPQHRPGPRPRRAAPPGRGPVAPGGARVRA